MTAVAASSGRPGELRSPPKLPGGLPWFGHVAAFARDPVGYLRWGRDQAGPVFSFVLLGSQVVVLSGPAAQEAVFRADEALLSPREAYRFMVPVFGEGVAYGTEPAVMDEQLGFVLRALTAKRLQAYAEFMAEEAETYFGTWGEQGEADLFDVMNELTVRIASRCLVGEEFRARLTDDLPRLYHDLEGGIRLAGLVNPYLPLLSFRRRDRARDRITKVILGIMAERRADGGSSAEDFIATLMAARYADGSPLPDAIVAGILLTLIFAGQHTSAVLATWTGVLLLEHSKHLPAVLIEQHRLFIDDDPSMTLGKLRQMTLLEWCIKEAERMHPPLVVLMRMAMGEFVHDGYRVPAGSLVMVSPGVSHRLPEVFSDPDNYDPYRFAPDREEDRRTPYAMIGFGGGKHRCIGLAFAYQQVKVIWSVLFRRYELELLQQPIRPDYSTFVAGPRRPCRVRYRLRGPHLG